MPLRLLSGIKLLEIANLRSGPYACRLMSDLGAEVIKVEDPSTGGDASRRYGPFPNDEPHREKSGLYFWLNRNKKSVTLNPQTVMGRKILNKLALRSDIVIIDRHFEHARELGLDLEFLNMKNPSLILTSITPFGNTGTYNKYASYEINCCGAGGVSIASGEPDREPLVMPIAAGEYQAGVAAAGASLVAYYGRMTSGRGQKIDISEVEVLANNFVGQLILRYIYQGVTGLRRGHIGGYFNFPNSCLPCADGYICLIAPQESQWRRFVEVLGNPEWMHNDRYKNRRAMLEKYPKEAEELLVPWLKEHSKQEIDKLCRLNHIPFAPVKTISDVIDDGQINERHFFTNISHSELGNIKSPGTGYEFLHAEHDYEIPAPLLGQHNKEIFCDYMGYSEKDLFVLTQTGVV